MKSHMQTLLGIVPLLVALTGLCLLVYAAVQQEYRQTWNDPQIELVNLVSKNMDAGKPFGDALDRPLRRWDLSEDRDMLWVALFDTDGKPIASEVMLDGAPVLIPTGVFADAKADHGKDTRVSGQNRITWQPREGVRSAVVVQYDTNISKFIVAGRNLRELEIREGNLSALVFIAWAVLVFSVLCAQYAIPLLRKYV